MWFETGGGHVKPVDVFNQLLKFLLHFRIVRRQGYGIIFVVRNVVDHDFLYVITHFQKRIIVGIHLENIPVIDQFDLSLSLCQFAGVCIKDVNLAAQLVFIAVDLRAL